MNSNIELILSAPAFELLARFETADLIAAYNRLTGKVTSKFATRARGMQQVWAAIQAHNAAQEEPPPRRHDQAGSPPE